MPRYALTLEYAGTRYSGWQIQTNARTVQGELHDAIKKGLLVDRFETYGSGRTDAGVHALAQVAHLDLAKGFPTDSIRDRVNGALPHDINVLSVERREPRFHARHSAVARSYVYQLATRRTAFAKPYVWWVTDALDLTRMADAGIAMIGLSDFQSFTDDDPEEKSTKVLLDAVHVEQRDHLILIRVVGSHFLWKMVRRMVGVMVEVGRGGLRPADVGRMLSTRSALPARLTAPSSGLFLERVFYEPPPLDWPLEPPLFTLR